MNEEKDSSSTVSDEQLIDRLREFLKNSDLNTTTTAIVRRKLEEDFGVDLTDRKGFIRQQVDLFLQTQMEKPAEEEEDDDDVDKEDEQKSKLKSDSKQEQSESDPDTEEEEEEVSSGDEISSNGKGRKKSVKNKDVKKKAVGGFSKLCSLSPELQNVLGAPEMPRTEVVKQIWKYIQARDLQDPSNRKNIRCDEALRAVFKVDIIGMLQMNKALTRHIWPLGSDAAPDPSTVKEKPPKEKTKKRKKREDPEDSQSKEKRVNCSGFLAPYPLSDALIKFIGTGESAMPRASVVKLIWGYIKEHNLQDPSDKKTILCDEKLKELFNVESFVGFTVPRLLKDHFIKAQPSQ